MLISFKNKVVLVTGAGRGLGFQMAKDFVDAGAHLILTAARPASLKQMQRYFKKHKVNCHRLDLTDPLSVGDFLKRLAPYPRIDVCVNNAGINHIDFLEDTKPEDWDDMVSVNLKGPYLLTRAVGQKMKKRGYGRIVNICSIFGIVSRPKRSIYSMTKSGLIGFTTAVSNELASYGVLVNAVSPGFILTDLTRKNLSPAELKSLITQIPVGRLGQPSDISGVVLYLASEFNTYITGKNIVVDGGFIDA
jgi:3-oxoacyl-[acyl-carrier protein] reductase